MNVSHAWVHAVVEDTPNNGGDNANAPPRVRMKEIQGMAGTPGGLSLRLLQFVLAAAALLLMASIIDFPSVTAFRQSLFTIFIRILLKGLGVLSCLSVLIQWWVIVHIIFHA